MPSSEPPILEVDLRQLDGDLVEHGFAEFRDKLQQLLANILETFAGLAEEARRATQLVQLEQSNPVQLLSAQ